MDTKRWKLGLLVNSIPAAMSGWSINMATFTSFFLKYILYLVSGMSYSLDFPPSQYFLLILLLFLNYNDWSTSRTKPSTLLLSMHTTYWNSRSLMDDIEIHTIICNFYTYTPKKSLKINISKQELLIFYCPTTHQTSSTMFLIP